MVQACCLSHLLVGWSVWWMNCGKRADWMWMPFGAVSGVGQGMDVLDGDEVIKGEGGILGINVGHPTVTNGDFVA